MNKIMRNSSTAPSDHSRNDSFHQSGRNVFHLLARREISPRAKHLPRGQWEEISKGNATSLIKTKTDAARDPRRGLLSWVEAESLQHLTANYCSLEPPPRSTIATAFSPDGRTLASTHGDHTVKVINCHTGKCLKVLSGHRRTPWVVRFHPVNSEILASGSLDHEVRIWNSNTSECIGSCDFYRPIASIAFHAHGELLSVASGHKLYMWHYNRKGEGSSPAIVLKTKRSLRAVHFHPLGAPFLLTAEVNDLDSSDSSVTPATSLGYLQYPPPTVYFANAHSSDSPSLAAELPLLSRTVPSDFAMQPAREDLQQSQAELSPMELQTDVNIAEQFDYMETSPALPFNPFVAIEGSGLDYFPNELGSGAHYPTMGGVVSPEVQSQLRNQQIIEPGQIHQFLPGTDASYWDLPFLQGWLVGQGQAGLPSTFPYGTDRGYSSNFGTATANWMSNFSMYSLGAPAAALAAAESNSIGITGMSGFRPRFSESQLRPVSESREGAASVNTSHDGLDAQPIISRIQSEIATSLAATAPAELPCTVKLRIWSHDAKNPSTPLSAERCRLTVPHAVLCSEMGAHFSPCGRFLAACVACTLPCLEADSESQMQYLQDNIGAATSPTRHPISRHQVMYELRIYSLEEATFGSVLVSRAIRAAHCLTSIQFSPTSDHILLAYGRRHGSLLKSIVIDGEATLPIFTILETYRVKDMELVSVLPSAEDEVNVASFHPLAGGGLVYGTKEGKLRILQYDGVHLESTGGNFSEEKMTQLQSSPMLRRALGC